MLIHGVASGPECHTKKLYSPPAQIVNSARPPSPQCLSGTPEGAVDLTMCKGLVFAESPDELKLELIDLELVDIWVQVSLPAFRQLQLLSSNKCQILEIVGLTLPLLFVSMCGCGIWSTNSRYISVTVCTLGCPMFHSGNRVMKQVSFRMLIVSHNSKASVCFWFGGSLYCPFYETWDISPSKYFDPVGWQCCMGIEFYQNCGSTAIDLDIVFAQTSPHIWKAAVWMQSDVRSVWFIYVVFYFHTGVTFRKPSRHWIITVWRERQTPWTPQDYHRSMASVF